MAEQELTTHLVGMIIQSVQEQLRKSSETVPQLIEIVREGAQSNERLTATVEELKRIVGVEVVAAQRALADSNAKLYDALTAIQKYTECSKADLAAVTAAVAALHLEATPHFRSVHTLFYGEGYKLAPLVKKLRTIIIAVSGIGGFVLLVGIIRNASGIIKWLAAHL